TVVCWPGRLTPGKINEPVQITDWMPTFCALAGFQPEQDLKWDGLDVWPLLSGQVRRLPSRALYTPFTRGSALRDGDWKLIVSADGASTELFNLTRDPSETIELAAQMPDRVRALRQRLA